MIKAGPGFRAYIYAELFSQRLLLPKKFSRQIDCYSRLIGAEGAESPAGSACQVRARRRKLRRLSARPAESEASWRGKQPLVQVAAKFTKTA
ncbi:hypothetical protein BIV59_05115 [Bacillus sp. MUM 13]|nr:hypothetical protein BIV59_05115 [Bacillus sp. MUM 13]